eukprot:5747920-Karenia_brevis.AAC.2
MPNVRADPSHKLAVIGSDTVCLQCGAYGGRIVRGLLKPCGKATRAGRKVIKSVLKGQGVPRVQKVTEG